MKRLLFYIMILMPLMAQGINWEDIRLLYLAEESEFGTSKRGMISFDGIHYAFSAKFVSPSATFTITDAVNNPEYTFGLPPNAENPVLNEPFTCACGKDVAEIRLPSGIKNFDEAFIIFNLETHELVIRDGLETVHSNVTQIPEDGLLPPYPYENVALVFDVPVCPNPFDMADRAFWITDGVEFKTGYDFHPNWLTLQIMNGYSSGQIWLSQDEAFLVTYAFQKVELDITSWYWGRAERLPELAIVFQEPEDKDVKERTMLFDSNHGYYYRAQGLEEFSDNLVDATFFITENASHKTFGVKPNGPIPEIDTPFELYDGMDALPIPVAGVVKNLEESHTLGLQFNYKENTILFFQDDLKSPEMFVVNPPEGIINYYRWGEIVLDGPMGMFPNKYYDSTETMSWEGVDEPTISGATCRFPITGWGTENDTPHDITITVPNGYFSDYMCRTLWFDTNESSRTYRWQYRPETGVDELVTGNTVTRVAVEGIYDMLGRRIGTVENRDALPAGLYIIDGKKVLITL